MKNILLIIITSIALNTATGQTLVQCKLKAAEQNAKLNSLFLEYQATFELIEGSATLPDPQLSFGYFISPVETRVGAQRARFSVSQMFPWFGTLKEKRGLQVAIAEGAFHKFEKFKKNLYSQIDENYEQALSLEAQEIMVRAHLTLLRNLETIVTNGVESGEASIVDAFRLQMEILNAEEELSTLGRDMDLAITKLTALVNNPDGTRVTIDGTQELKKELFTRQVVLDSVLLGNSGIAQLGAAELAADHRMRLSYKSAAPKLGAGLTYIATEQRSGIDIEDNGKDVLLPVVSLTLPVYRKKNKSSQKYAELMLNKVQEERTDLKNDLVVQLEASWNKIDDATRQIEVLAEQVELALSLREVLIESYASGKSEFEEILRIEDSVLKLQKQQIININKHNIELSVVHSLM